VSSRPRRPARQTALARAHVRRLPRLSRKWPLNRQERSRFSLSGHAGGPPAHEPVALTVEGELSILWPMRNALRVILPALAAAVVACSCSWISGGGGREGKIVLKVTPVEHAGKHRDLYRLELYYLLESRDKRSEPADFWRFFDETVVPGQHRRLLAANGLRVAVGGELAVKRLNAVIVNQANVRARPASTVRATTQQILDVPLGVALGDCMVFYESGDGALSGREFTKASTMVRFHCRAAERPNHTVVRVCLQIVHGDRRPKHLPTATGVIMGTELPKFRFKDLETEVTLREGQVLAVGLAPGRAMSIGRHLFARQRDGGTDVTTLLLVPVLESSPAAQRSRPATPASGGK